MSENILQMGRGAKQTPIDYRQIKLTHIAGDAPALPADGVNIMLDFSKVPDFFQRQIGACQNHAFVELFTHRLQRLNGSSPLLSPRFPYTMCKIEDLVTPADDQGTYSCMPFKMGVKYGVASQEVVPNDTTLDFLTYIYNRTIAQMPAEAFTDANKNRIPGYVQVGSTNNVTAEDLSQALTQEPDGILIQVHLGNEWYTNAAGQPSWKMADLIGTTGIRKTVTVIDDHDICVYGLQTETGTGRIKVYFRNHWSLNWASTSGIEGGTGPEDTNGDSGWFYLDEHPIVEAWIPSEIPAAILAIVQALPSQATFSHVWSETLKPGMSGPDVLALQIALKIIGTFPFLQPVTDYFGPVTAAAVQAWQTRDNVASAAAIASAAGAVGPLSLAVLNKMFSHQ